MANSRKSPPLNNLTASPEAACQRALEAILARVVVSDRIAIALSGGLDSTVLLHLATAFCRQRDIELFAFHIHHGLSPNADHWLAHSERQARETGVKFDACRVHIDPDHKVGTEQAARQARYAALAGLCKTHAVSLLLTAHHQDDQAETVLLQLLRGAGLPGLSAMAQLQTDHALLGPGITLGRPLLETTRAALDAYARAQALSHIVDESNHDLRFRRNDIRHQAMPALEQQLPGVQASLARSARHLQSAQRLLDELAAMDLQSCVDDSALVIARLRLLNEDRLDNLLRYWLRQCGAKHYPSNAQLRQLREQMLLARDDAHPMLVICGLVLERYLGRLVANHLPSHHLSHHLNRDSGQRSGAPDVRPADVLVHWQGESEILIPAWQGRLHFEPSAGPSLGREQLLQGPLRLRARSGGERLKLHARRPSRTLKNLFQESAVPLRQRGWLPLIYLGDELVFAAGLGMDVRAETASEGIRLHWQPEG
jgi:tRNA(Ile)-lysidine synthase